MSKKNILIISIIGTYLILVGCGLYFNIIPYVIEVKAQSEADVAAKEIIDLLEASEVKPVLIQEPFKKEFSVADKYKAVLEKMPDVVGKVKIEDTNIDYLAVQADNNDYYLKKDYDGQESKSGSIFLDFNSNVKQIKENLKGNIVLYGHNMKSGTMFHNLRYYKNEKYLNEHKIIEFDTLSDDLKWEVFSVYVDSGNCIGNDTVFDGEEGYKEFLTEIKNKSLVETDVSLDNTSCILSLITCDYSTDDGRLFIHAKMLAE
jgi:sortase B